MLGRFKYSYASFCILLCMIVTSVNYREQLYLVNILSFFFFYEHCYDDSNTFTVVESSVVIMLLSASTVMLSVDTAVKLYT